MSREIERETVITHFLTVWNTADGPIAVPNQRFTTPIDHFFGDVKIVERGTFRMSLGASFYKRHNSTLQLDMYTPFGEGTKLSRSIADRLELVYEELTLLLPGGGEFVKFGTPSSRRLAQNRERAENLNDNWDRYVFEAPYYRDQRVEK